MKMNKNLVLLIAAFMMIAGSAYAVEGPFGYDLQKDINRAPDQKDMKWQQDQSQETLNSSAATLSADGYAPVTDKDIFGDESKLPMYYPNATMKSAITKYKNNNYTGCIQELYSVLKKDKNNSMAYYYLAMAYVKAGKKEQANAAYQKVINLNKNEILVDYATKGKACLSGDPSCTGIGSTGETDAMDKFISSPYGNGFSPELNVEWKKKQLLYLQDKMNKGGTLTPEEVRQFNEFGKSKSNAISGERLALADNGSKKNSEMPSNDEIINALNVLKRSGLNISTQTPDTQAVQPVTQQVNPMAYMPDPQIQQMSMMLGGNNNNSNPDPMMYMMPYMMNSNNGQNIDPKVIQSMMMNSMMNSLNGMNPVNNNN